MCAINRLATSTFESCGQFSTLSLLMRCTLFLSLPNTPDDLLTLLAIKRSQPFFINLALACSIIFSVSAANPTTNLARDFPFLESVAYMSGFSMKVSEGTSPDFVFFILFEAAFATFQSAIAAAQITTS